MALDALMVLGLCLPLTLGGLSPTEYQGDNCASSQGLSLMEFMLSVCAVLPGLLLGTHAPPNRQQQLVAHQ